MYQNMPERVLPSIFVERYKPAEEAGAAPKEKSRWCVQGFRDPDIWELETSCPTPQSSSILLVLQILASCNFRAANGDVHTAFMQG